MFCTACNVLFKHIHVSAPDRQKLFPVENPFQMQYTTVIVGPPTAYVPTSAVCGHVAVIISKIVVYLQLRYICILL